MRSHGMNIGRVDALRPAHRFPRRAAGPRVPGGSPLEYRHAACQASYARTGCGTGRVLGLFHLSNGPDESGGFGQRPGLAGGGPRLLPLPARANASASRAK